MLPELCQVCFRLRSPLALRGRRGAADALASRSCVCCVHAGASLHYAAIARALAEAEQGGDMPNAGRSFSRVKRRVEARAAA
jgi:hypothetical protein